jgi:hypothetical protein
MPVEITPGYMQAARRFHDNHPHVEAAMHRLFLGGLGLSEDAQQEIVNRKAPELTQHPRIGQIGSRPKSEHAEAVRALHESEQSGPNQKTDNYLRSRGKLSMPTHSRRRGLVR